MGHFESYLLKEKLVEEKSKQAYKKSFKDLDMLQKVYVLEDVINNLLHNPKKNECELKYMISVKPKADLLKEKEASEQLKYKLFISQETFSIIETLSNIKKTKDLEKVYCINDLELMVVSNLKQE